MSIFSAEPEAIFLPKFENAGAGTRELYTKIDSNGGHVFVAAIKSSGSLWVASCRAGKIVATSKNGSGNVFSSAGHYALLCKLQKEFGPEWRSTYEDLLMFLDRNNLSLGCELVTKCLGNHASHPNEDHLVVNAILHKSTMQPCSPLLLLEVRSRFRLEISGMYMFLSSAKFLETFDQFRFAASATSAEIMKAMEAAAWRFVHMPYDKLHSNILEGFVCSMVPQTAELMKWAESYVEGIREGMSDMTMQACSPQEALKSVSELYDLCGESLSALHTEMERLIAALEISNRQMEPARVDDVFALIRHAKREAEGQGASMFRAMVDALERLAIPHALKCFRDSSSGYLVHIHILQDWGFPRYEKERESRPDAGMPPLLRGNTWYLSFRGDAGTPRGVSMEWEPSQLPEAMTRDRKRSDDLMCLSGEDSPQPTKIARRCMTEADSAHVSDLTKGGPMFGATYKFKLLSYTHRTFLFRNCGTSLAKTADMDTFQRDVSRLLRVWDVPADVAGVMTRRARAWGRFILSLGEEERKDIAQGKYLSALERFDASPHLTVTADQNAAAEGLVVIVSPHVRAIDMAHRMAARMGAGVVVRQAYDVAGEAQVRTMAEFGGIILCHVTDRGSLKVLRALQELPTRGVRVVVALVDLCEQGARDSLGSNVDERELKKTVGMTTGVSNKIPKETSGLVLVRVERNEGMSVESFMEDAHMDAACAQMMNAMAALASNASSNVMQQSDDSALATRMQKLYVVVFVTIVGWGKNQVCDLLHGEGAGLCGALGIEGGGHWQILEGDKLQGAFWSEVSRAVADPSLRLLVLNRNFPPNSWEPTLRKLQAASEGKRLIVPIAVVPKSVGRPGSPFTLCDLAVCMHGVSGRTGHGTQLDQSHAETAKVTTMFYRMYDGVGGWHQLIDNIRAQFAPNIAVVEWLKEGSDDSCPPALRTCIEHVLSTGGVDEQGSRDCLNQHAAFIQSCRLPPEQVAGSFKNAVRCAIVDAQASLYDDTATGVQPALAGGEEAVALPKYITIELEDGAKFAQEVLAMLPDHLAATSRPSDGRKGYHVTMWHAMAHSNVLPEHLVALEGSRVSVRARMVAVDDACICVSVDVGEPCEGMCMNKHAHVTLWVAEGTQNKYSNDLLNKAPFHAGLPGGCVLQQGKTKGYFASLLKDEESLDDVPVSWGTLVVNR